MEKLLATIDDDFAKIDHLLKELRKRIARASEAVHVVMEKKARKAPSHKRRSRAATRR